MVNFSVQSGIAIASLVYTGHNCVITMVYGTLLWANLTLFWPIFSIHHRETNTRKIKNDSLFQMLKSKNKGSLRTRAVQVLVRFYEDTYFSVRQYFFFFSILVPCPNMMATADVSLGYSYSLLFHSSTST